MLASLSFIAFISLTISLRSAPGSGPGCAKPGNSQPETRGGHDETTTSAPRGHDVGSMGPHGDGDVEVRVSGSEGEEPRELTLAEAPREDGGKLPEGVRQMVEKQAPKRIGMRFHPTRTVTCDHRKLGGTY